MGVLRDNLEPTDFADAVCRVSPWHPFGHYGYSENRVWLCRCGGHWFQRHEWAQDGKNHTQTDPWIYVGYSLTRTFPSTMLADGLALIKDMAA
jgi:hypothetical protein